MRTNKSSLVIAVLVGLATASLANAGVTFVSQFHEVGLTIGAYETKSDGKSSAGPGEFNESISLEVPFRNPPVAFGANGARGSIEQLSRVDDDGIFVDAGITGQTYGDFDTVTYLQRVTTTFIVDAATTFALVYNLDTTSFPHVTTEPPAPNATTWNQVVLRLEKDGVVLNQEPDFFFPSAGINASGSEAGVLEPGEYTFTYLYNLRSDYIGSFSDSPATQSVSLTFDGDAPPAVPLPASVWTGLIGLAGVVAGRRYWGRKYMTS